MKDSTSTTETATRQGDILFFLIIVAGIIHFNTMYLLLCMVIFTETTTFSTPLLTITTKAPTISTATTPGTNYISIIQN